MTSAKVELPTEPVDFIPFARFIRVFRALPLLLLLEITTSHANEVVVVDAKSHCEQRVCRFDVTLAHADSGWDHYADLWRILDTEGHVLGTRTLLHPHVDEQPFTRSLSNVTIPIGMSRVIIEARDTVHGLSPHRLILDLELP